MSNNRATVIITGKTTREIIDEMRLIERAEEHGVQSPQIKTCYLCKREEGQDTVRVHEYEGSVQLPPLELVLYEINMSEGINFGYWLCDECVLLLSDFSTRSFAD
jgi:hypothetical protein